MLQTYRSALIGLVFFVGVLLVVGAFEIHEDARQHGELLSLTINQCPDRSGDACRVNYSLPLEFDIKFKTRVPFERIYVSYLFNNYFWLLQNPGTTEPRKKAHWFDHGICQTDDSFCPGHVGDERTYYNELDLSETTDLWATPGRLAIYMRNEHLDDILLLHFPMVGYS